MSQMFHFGYLLTVRSIGCMGVKSSYITIKDYIKFIYKNRLIRPIPTKRLLAT